MNQGQLIKYHPCFLNAWPSAGMVQGCTPHLQVLHAIKETQDESYKKVVTCRSHTCTTSNLEQKVFSAVGVEKRRTL